MSEDVLWKVWSTADVSLLIWTQVNLQLIFSDYFKWIFVLAQISLGSAELVFHLLKFWI